MRNSWKKFIQFNEKYWFVWINFWLLVLVFIFYNEKYSEEEWFKIWAYHLLVVAPASSIPYGLLIGYLNKYVFV